MIAASESGTATKGEKGDYLPGPNTIIFINRNKLKKQVHPEKI
jgi:hypothetical protein